MKIAVLIESASLRSPDLQKQLLQTGKLNEKDLDAKLSQSNRQALQLASQLQTGNEITAYILGQEDKSLVIMAKASGANEVIIDHVNGLSSSFKALTNSLRDAGLVIAGNLDADGQPNLVGAKVAANLGLPYFDQVESIKQIASGIAIGNQLGTMKAKYLLTDKAVFTASDEIKLSYLDAKEILAATDYQPKEIKEGAGTVVQSSYQSLLQYQISLAKTKNVDTTSGASKSSSSKQNQTQPDASKKQVHQLTGSEEEIAKKILQIVAEKREG